MTEPSKSRVNKAGKRVRWAQNNDDRASDIDISSELQIIDHFRASHQIPLSKANMGLRSMVSSEGLDVEVSQRLKRMPTIVNKIAHREPTLALANMQDIGGCRAVLSTVDEIRRVQARIEKRPRLMSVNDYIENPRDSGYRGVHVVVSYDGRQIEIQFRTRAMHEWAMLMEQFSAQSGVFLKTEGDHPIQQWMSYVAEAMYLEESGQTVGQALLSKVRDARESARPFISELATL